MQGFGRGGVIKLISSPRKKGGSCGPNVKHPIQGRSLAQIRGGGPNTRGGGGVPPEQVPGGNSSVNFGDN